MKLTETLQAIERIDALIRRKATGSPKELSRKLQVSERTIYNLLDVMREMGAPIEYNQSQGSYLYRHSGKIGFGFFLDKQVDSNIYGGIKVLNFDDLLSLQNFCSDMS